MMKHIISLTAAILLLALSPANAEPGTDPLKSVNWTEMRQQFFGDAPFQFDDRIKVIVPSIVENQAQVPVTTDARALANVVKLVVFADLNPVKHVLTLTPIKAEAYVSFRMKVEQATPVRAAALTSDGVWHVGGVYLDAAGGGCSSPALARKKEDWSLTVGNTRGRLWRELDGTTRVRMSIRHPMDTGLTPDNIPAFYIETLQMKSPSGEPLATLEMREPVSENPTLTLLLRNSSADADLRVQGRDTGGSIYSSKIPALWNQSSLAPSSTKPTVAR